MARSLKKGPFADASLLKKIDEMNKNDQKEVFNYLPFIRRTYNCST